MVKASILALAACAAMTLHAQENQVNRLPEVNGREQLQKNYSATET